MSVYFIKVGRYIKVGFSDNPQRRALKLWQSGTRYTRPWDLPLAEVPELLLAVDGDKSDEHFCHLALWDYGAGLEWFVDEPGVREFMTKVEGYIRGQKVPFPKVERPGGEFEPVPWTEMLPEREVEIAGQLARTRQKHLARQESA